MHQRLIVAFLFASLPLACSGGGSTGGTGGKRGGTGGVGAGSGGSSSGTGGSDTGTGGATTGTGGAGTGTGGATSGTGGTGTGSGGATTGSGGRGTGGATTGSGGAGTGGRGTGGSTGTGGRGTGGVSGTGGAGVGTADQNVLERNKNPSRDGHFIQPTLTKATAATMAADTAFNTAATFSGNVAASPTYLDGPNGTGLFFITADNGDVIARKENGMSQWTRSIGSPAGGGIGCGGRTSSLGILSTPVIDAQTRTIYAAGIAGSAQAQIASAINIDDGTVKSGWPVNVSSAASFDPKIHNQRSALSLVKGILYVAYSGFVGDCGSYRGRVVAINTANPTMVGQWQTSDNGGGIWAPGGLASDGNSVYATTGNYVPLGSAPSTHGDSEQVTKITGMGTKADFFYPTTWASMDRDDADFGSVNPIFITVPGATPSRIIAALAKDGRGYLLDADQLHGSAGGNTAGGQKAMFTLSNGNSLFGAPASYRTATATYVVMASNMVSGCPGGGSGRQVMAVRISPSPLGGTVAWCAPMSGGPTSPIATTTDGTSDAVVWYISNGQLKGVDGDTGAAIYSSTNTCSGIQKWTSPIAVKGRIIAAANGRFCAWGIPGALTRSAAAPMNKTELHGRKLAQVFGRRLN